MSEPSFAQVLDRLRTILDEAEDSILEREIVLGYKWTFYEVLRANGEWVVCYDNIPFSQLNVPKRIAAVKNLKDFLIMYEDSMYQEALKVGGFIRE